MKPNSNSFRTTFYICSISSLVLVSFSPKAEVYKWKNASGIMQYSDVAPTNLNSKPASKQLKALLAAQTMCSADENLNPVTALNMSNTKTQLASAAMSVSNSKTAKPTLQQANLAISFGTPVKKTSTTTTVSKSLSSIISALKVNTTTTTTTAPTTTTTSSMNTGTMGMPYVNLSLAPPPEAGKSFIDLIPQNHVPVPSGGSGGDFRIQCSYSHMLNDDPIVYPNQAGKAHLHTFFGNTGAKASSTTESLVAGGNSTCDGGIMNRSAYWIPSIIDTRTGKPIRPTGMNVYYKSGSRSVVVPPKGLRMIAGDMRASSTQPYMHFWCNNQAGSDQGYIPACPVGDALIAVVPFPSWWDGKNLDSADHKSHMSYVRTATHTVQIPDITYNIRYDVKTGDDLNKWRLSSDMYGTDKKGGYSLHGDWMNGWIDDPKSGKNFTAIFTEKCLQAGMNCGNALLGDGRQYYY